MAGLKNNARLAIESIFVEKQVIHEEFLSLFVDEQKEHSHVGTGFLQIRHFLSLIEFLSYPPIYLHFLFIHFQ
jgi:hypothetical protein